MIKKLKRTEKYYLKKKKLKKKIIKKLLRKNILKKQLKNLIKKELIYLFNSYTILNFPIFYKNLISYLDKALNLKLFSKSVNIIIKKNLYNLFFLN